MKKKRERTKTGRNNPCPCGSGKKYKKCNGEAATHGDWLPHQQALDAGVHQKMAELDALQKQREKQQGLGRPILSFVFQGYRFVAVRNELYYSKEWKTFRDFLSPFLSEGDRA